MGHKRTSGWGLTRNEAALFGAIIVYGILVVAVSPLLLGFLPILGVGWLLRVPVTSTPADRAVVEIEAAESVSPAPAPAGSAGSGATTPVSSRSSASA